MSKEFKLEIATEPKEFQCSACKKVVIKQCQSHENPEAMEYLIEGNPARKICSECFLKGFDKMFGVEGGVDE